MVIPSVIHCRLGEHDEWGLTSVVSAVLEMVIDNCEIRWGSRMGAFATVFAGLSIASPSTADRTRCNALLQWITEGLTK